LRYSNTGYENLGVFFWQGLGYQLPFATLSLVYVFKVVQIGMSLLNLIALFTGLVVLPLTLVRAVTVCRRLKQVLFPMFEVEQRRIELTLYQTPRCLC
jgi:hypothetical protein